MKTVLSILLVLCSLISCSNDRENRSAKGEKPTPPPSEKPFEGKVQKFSAEFVTGGNLKGGPYLAYRFDINSNEINKGALNLYDCADAKCSRKILLYTMSCNFNVLTCEVKDAQGKGVKKGGEYKIDAAAAGDLQTAGNCLQFTGGVYKNCFYITLVDPRLKTTGFYDQHLAAEFVPVAGPKSELLNFHLKTRADGNPTPTAAPIPPSVPAQPAAPISNDDQHITVTGAVYVRDTSNINLGEAYRDPRGLIWGDAALDRQSRKPLLMNFAEAQKYCQKLSLRLPNEKEGRTLRDDFGYDKDVSKNSANYSQMTSDKSRLVLPNSQGFDERYIWIDEGSRFETATTLELSRGHFGYGSDKRKATVRCVQDSRETADNVTPAIEWIRRKLNGSQAIVYSGTSPDGKSCSLSFSHSNPGWGNMNSFSVGVHWAKQIAPLELDYSVLVGERWPSEAELDASKFTIQVYTLKGYPQTASVVVELDLKSVPQKATAKLVGEDASKRKPIECNLEKGRSSRN